MKTLFMALAFVLALNTVLFIAQIAITEINPNSPVNFHYAGSVMSDYDSGNYTLREFQAGDLPATETSVSEEGNFFTDTFSTIKNWLLTNIPGLKYLVAIVNTVPNFLKAVGVDPEIAFAFGYFWHVLHVFIAIAWLKS